MISLLLKIGSRSAERFVALNNKFQGAEALPAPALTTLLSSITRMTSFMYLNEKIDVKNTLRSLPEGLQAVDPVPILIEWCPNTLNAIFQKLSGSFILEL